MAVDKINNGKYYLVEKTIDEKIHLIYLNQNWYLEKGSDCEQKRLDIAAIDVMTLQHPSEESFKEFLYEQKKIQSKDSEILLVRKNKYHGKESIRTYPLIFGQHELLPALAKKRLDQQEIGLTEVKDLLFHFVGKLNKPDKSFKKFVLLYLGQIDHYLKDQILSAMSDGKVNVQVIYKNNTLKSYHALRNIIFIWKQYDHYIQQVEKDNINIELFFQKNQPKTCEKTVQSHHTELLKKMNPNHIEGQMNMFDQKGNFVSYQDELATLFDQAKALKESNYDHPELQRAFQLQGKEGVIIMLGKIDIKSLSLEDRCRIGFIDYVEYKNLKHKADTQIKSGKSR